MEVHAHTHSPRQKWTHYFWEFLMLFLAVFCGFLAEDQREHMVEHRREKKYAALLLADLREDSSLLSRRIKNVETRKQIAYEELTQLLTQQPPASDKEIIPAFMEFAGRFMIPLTTTTFTEMKASGALRYVRNQSLISALKVYYDNWVPVVQYSTEETRTFFNTYLQPYYLRHLRAQDLHVEVDTLIRPDPVILGRSKETDQELLNYTRFYFSQMRYSLIANKCKPALGQIELLITMLKDEYHLK